MSTRRERGIHGAFGGGGTDTRLRGSPEQELRGQIRFLLGDKCDNCEALSPLDIHHISNDGREHRRKFAGDRVAYYEDVLRLIHEGSTNFGLLCRKCHDIDHPHDWACGPQQ